MSSPVPTRQAMKTCRVCGQRLPLDVFHRDRSKADGRVGLCKPCVSVEGRRWRERNVERISEKGRKYYLKNRVKVREQHRAWREANPELIKESGRAWKRANAEKARGYARKWQRANPEQYKASRRKWSRANRDKHREEVARRRALARAAPVDIGLIRKLLESPCTYCGSTEHIEIDHIVPLSRGGTHEPENLAPSCRSCNRSKGAKLLSEWGLP